MLSTVLLVVLLVLLPLLFFDRKPKKLPPGIWGLPIIGKLPSKETALSDEVEKIRRKHGNIVSWRLGSRIFIFFCDYKVIKSAFAKPEFADRPDFYSFDIFTDFSKIGIINSNGQVWQNNRRFTLRHLRDLGMGKTRLEEAIQFEASCLVKDFERLAGKPGPLPWSINVAVLNVIWQMVASRRYDVDDQEMHKFNKLVNSSLEDFQGNAIWFDMMPWLIPIVPKFVKEWMGVEQIYDKRNAIFKPMLSHIKHHQATLDWDNPRDYIDAYLMEMEEQKHDPDSTMNIQDLKNCLSDLFVAGSETTSSTIRWAIYYLAKYPDIQARVHEEIDSVVSRDTLPSIQQKNSMPYLEAVTLEVHRMASLIRLGIFHFCSRDTEFEGYTIPKDAVLVAQQEGCHRDPAYWERPDEFYPEHFLDKEGKVISKKEGFLPFCLGRRQCLGESLARMELFVFLSALLQNFSFSAPDGEELSVEKDPNQRLISLPKPLDIVITKRK